MIPLHLSLVPFSPERRAAMEAIAEVERRRSRGAVSAAYPYASAFFRRLTGRARISLREIHHFAPVLTARELRDEKYTRQRRKESCQRERAYQALAGQAEIELAFHTPEIVSSWSAG